MLKPIAPRSGDTVSGDYVLFEWQPNLVDSGGWLVIHRMDGSVYDEELAFHHSEDVENIEPGSYTWTIRGEVDQGRAACTEYLEMEDVPFVVE